MSKNKDGENDKKTIENEIEEISENLTQLSKSTKLKDILKKHKSIKNSLSETFEKINLLKTSFESNIESPKEIIDDSTYDKYSKEITEILESDFDQIDIESQIKKYKLLVKKITSCETHLKSKKMEIIDCDKKNKKEKKYDNNSDTSASVSSDEEK